MGGISEPIGEPVIVVHANYANRFVWRATDPLNGTTYTLRLIGDSFGYDATGLPVTGTVARVEIRTQTLAGSDSWAIYHTGTATPASLGPLTNPLAWVGTAEPVRPVIAMPTGVPITHIDGNAYTTGLAQDDIIGPLRGLAMVASGGAGDDTLAGTALADTLNGDDGFDLILGGGGNDSLTGGFGMDTLRGGLGDDRLEGGYDVDELFGAAGDDMLFGGYGDDHLFAGDGDDSADGGEGDDRISLGAGNDTAIELGLGDDTLLGGSGADWLEGREGRDALYGGTENDRLIGGEGHDTLYGGAGDDLLIAGADADLLYGGAGADVFVFSQDEALNGFSLSETTIMDFTSGQDRLMIATGPGVDMAGAFALFLMGAQDIPGGVVWFNDMGAAVVLRGLSLADLSVGDILPEANPADYYLI